MANRETRRAKAPAPIIELKPDEYRVKDAPAPAGSTLETFVTPLAPGWVAVYTDPNDLQHPTMQPVQVRIDKVTTKPDGDVRIATLHSSMRPDGKPGLVTAETFPGFLGICYMPPAMLFAGAMEEMERQPRLAIPRA